MSKSLLRSFAINVAAFYLAAIVVPGLSYEGGIKTLLIATIILAVMNVLIKPIINLMLLPINVLTLGGFRWLVNVVVLFLLILLIDEIKIQSFIIPKLEFYGFVVPMIHVSNFVSLVLSSVTISILNAFIIWLFNQE